MKKFLLLLMILIAGGAYFARAAIFDWWQEINQPDVPVTTYEEIKADEINDDQIIVEDEVEEKITDPIVDIEIEEDVVTEEQEETTPSLPPRFNLAIPFTSQAPYSNWDAVHEDLCEEASMLMTALYYEGDSSASVSKDSAEAAMQKLKQFEDAFLGEENGSITAEQVAGVIEAYYYLTPGIVLNPTVNDLKTALAAGFPIIVPAAGRMLGNPNFTGEGPLYHMLVLKGYTESGFITNDPGTRNGADYFYTFDVLLNSIHDWNDGDVENGQKVVIIVRP